MKWVLLLRYSFGLRPVEGNGRGEEREGEGEVMEGRGRKDLILKNSGCLHIYIYTYIGKWAGCGERRRREVMEGERNSGCLHIINV